MSMLKLRRSGLIRLQRVSEGKVRIARSFRRKMTEAERVLWNHLRNRKLEGLKFRRQQIIDGFVADFYCEDLRLCVEVDGAVHDTEKQRASDEHRTRALNGRGIHVLRVKNEMVLDNMSAVKQRILEYRHNTQIAPPLSCGRSETWR